MLLQSYKLLRYALLLHRHANAISIEPSLLHENKGLSNILAAIHDKPPTARVLMKAIATASLVSQDTHDQPMHQ